MTSNYDKTPSIRVSENSNDCVEGWENICRRVNNVMQNSDSGRIVIAIDCYQGVHHSEVETALRRCLNYGHFFNSVDAFKDEIEIREMVYPDVTDDRVFGFMTSLSIEQYFNEKRLLALRQEIKHVKKGIVIVYGEGACFVAEKYDKVIYLDMARWEIQLRMRNNKVNNLGLDNNETEFSIQYKQAYFVDWRVLDKYKADLIDRWDFVIDTNIIGKPKMITGERLRNGLKIAARRPFRVVPFFDPGPWGGQWLKEMADLDRSVINYAWAFDCVPEENSLLLKFGNISVEIPSINLVLKQPQALLGHKIYQKFGAEFPIRFDFLDTMDGGNLSLQVHPTKEYIKAHFGINYTQDESYYMLDVKEDAFVYLGLKENIDPEKMITELRSAQTEGVDFDTEKHVQKWPVKKHDHILIPAGTVHCSGKNSLVLEISATPYIFTFKLWDWGRLGLDGKPRPINIEHGEKVINWARKEAWTSENLINRIQKIAEGDGWIEESTGLHELQLIETRRHWFSKKITHHTNGGVNVLNLVEGREVVVESPKEKFEPFVVHFAETFIVPASIGEYTIKPYGASENEKCATLKAYIRLSDLANC